MPGVLAEDGDLAARPGDPPLPAVSSDPLPLDPGLLTSGSPMAELIVPREDPATTLCCCWACGSSREALPSRALDAWGEVSPERCGPSCRAPVGCQVPFRKLSSTTLQIVKRWRSKPCCPGMHRAQQPTCHHSLGAHPCYDQARTQLHAPAVPPGVLQYWL